MLGIWVLYVERGAYWRSFLTGLRIYNTVERQLRRDIDHCITLRDKVTATGLESLESDLGGSWQRSVEAKHLEDELEELGDECGEHGDGTERIVFGNTTMGANVHENVGRIGAVGGM
jgi:hypothetical protein